MMALSERTGLLCYGGGLVARKKIFLEGGILFIRVAFLAGMDYDTIDGFVGSYIPPWGCVEAQAGEEAVGGERSCRETAILQDGEGCPSLCRRAIGSGKGRDSGAQTKARKARTETNL